MSGQESGQQQGNQNGGQQQGQQGEQGQGQQQGLGILNGTQQSNESGDTNGGQQSTGEQGQQQGQAQGGQQPVVVDYDKIGQMIESTMDRRINAVVREVRGGQSGGQQQQQNDGNGTQGGNGQQQQGGNQQGSGQQQHTQSGPSQADVRDAKSIYREFIGDEIQFLSPDERAHALTLAGGLIETRLASGGNPDNVGREVAKEVATSVKSLRDLYESRLLSGLRQRGLLVETPGPGQQQVPGGTTAGQQSTYAAGQSKAQQRHPQQQQ